MANFEFSLQEIEHLARKLHSLRSHLSDDEQGLLEAIFAATKVQVTTRIPRDSPDDEEQGIAGLHQKFLDAYTPGEGIELILFFRIGDPTWPPK